MFESLVSEVFYMFFVLQDTDSEVRKLKTLTDLKAVRDSVLGFILNVIIPIIVQLRFVTCVGVFCVALVDSIIVPTKYITFCSLMINHSTSLFIKAASGILVSFLPAEQNFLCGFLTIDSKQKQRLVTMNCCYGYEFFISVTVLRLHGVLVSTLTKRHLILSINILH